jgi:hypothetical protein
MRMLKKLLNIFFSSNTSFPGTIVHFWSKLQSHFFHDGGNSDVVDNLDDKK